MGADNKTATNFFWALTSDAALSVLNSSVRTGLSQTEINSRHNKKQASNRSAFSKELSLFFSQFKNPLILLLVFGVLLSTTAGEYTNAIIIFSILFISGVLQFIQERNAGKAIEKLRSLIQVKSRVKREGKIIEISVDDVVPGDIILLAAGDILSADCLLLEVKDLYVNEAILTGESFPVEKKTGVLPEETILQQRNNCVFKGTNVISGSAVALAITTGKDTELGKIEVNIGSISEETAFEKGIKQFGYMLMKVALVLAGIILIINITIGRPALDSVLFALALSLGLAPELLPAIVSITLSAGAKRLASKKVIVKKLSSIQNLGSIDVLCSDKTGTLTEGEVRIHSYVSVDGKQNPLIQKYAYINALFESGYANPMDVAIRMQSKTDVRGFTKFDEVPYDFIRKRLSIVTAYKDKHLMITKGALANILDVCKSVCLSNGEIASIKDYLAEINKQCEGFSKDGYRTIGLCYKDVTGDPVINKDDEADMIFLGFILLNDPPRAGIDEVIRELKIKNVALKIITGDNTLIARSIASEIGIASDRIISGKDLHAMTDQALAGRVDEIDIFSETDPSQKERIVRALQQRGHVVGYLGDGINDASALKVADVGISVNNAVDVAKESADMILLQKELSVISDGITEGRKTYLNTQKYILITISANFGNMFSMAGASVLLPFLPLLPAQILLTNLLTDLPAISIASDNVDEELLRTPRKWDVSFIRKFMIVFGFESSLFDLLTFVVLIAYFHASPELFRSGWFVESVVTEVLILLIIRTRRTFFASLPGKYLLGSSLAVITIVCSLPYTPIAASFGLLPIPANVIICIAVISLSYSFVAEITKKRIFKKMNY